MRSTLLVLISLFSTLVASVSAQSFHIPTTQLDLSVAPGFNHADVRVPITPLTQGFDFTSLTVTSDAAWVVPSIESSTGQVRLVFQTGSLITSTTGTITVTGSGTTDSFFVKATVAPLNIVKFADDPVRSRTYGVQQDGVNTGSVIVIDPLDKSKIACVTVGKKPADLAVSADGSELLVINCVDETLTAIDLVTLRVTETVTLPEYDNWGINDTTADVGYGPGEIIYYTDGTWGPVLRVFNRTTKQVVQSVTDSGYGIGDFAVSSDGTSLYAWVQYGWSAGYAGSYAIRYSIDGLGKLTLLQKTSTTYPSDLMRDPLDTPVMLDAQGETAFIKQLAVNAGTITETRRSYPKPVYSITTGGEIAATESAIYQTSTGINLLNLPVTSAIQAITSDYSRLVYFNKTTREIGTIDLLAAIGPEILNRTISPADGSITLSPAKLQWDGIPGVDRYNVYLGTSESAVTNADPSSPSYLGQVNGPSYSFASTLTPGTKYFWRVDAVTSTGAVKGTVYEFTVSLIGTNLTAINTATIQGHANHEVAIELTAATPQAWQASANQNWITFKASTGTTPSTLTAVINASQLTAGTHLAQISVATTGQTPFVIPVSVEVEPLALKVMESDRSSGMVYAVSEDTQSGGSSRAYLLEIDSAAKTLKRVLRVGSSATDIAVHNADGVVYVTNWASGSLLAIDKATFKQVRAYGFKPFGGVGYGDGDVFRVAAGSEGRLLVEEMDQWIDISIYNTDTGTVLKKAFVREGGGEFGPGGRYYYHGENNSSGAEIRKFDVTGDAFTETAHVRIESASYYGSRTVVVSEDGNRVFWNGGALDANLATVWLMGKEVYSCTDDGRFAFGEEFIYDVNAKQTVLGMPAKTKVSAFNSTSRRLVTQVGSLIQFFDIGSPVSLVAPVLSVPSVTQNSAVLTWTDNSLETGFTLQYRVAGTTAWQDVQPRPGQNITTHTVVTLTAGTNYEFRIKADSSLYSSDWSPIATARTSDAPPAQTPIVTTNPATNVTSSSAVLNASVNPNGRSTSVHFEYGLTTSYGSTSSTVSAGSGTISVSVARTISGLLASSTYHYRVVATNIDGTSRGSDGTFTTSAAVPLVTTIGATSITSTSAKLTGSVNPNGLPTSAYYQYGTTIALDSSTNAVPVGNGTSAASFDVTITGLSPTTTYYYRLVASNSQGVSYGQTKSFASGTTGGGVSLPVVITGDAGIISSTGATVNGTVNPNGSPTYAWVEYGPNSNYGSSTPEVLMGSGAVTLPIQVAISNLAENQMYHYRVAARNEVGTIYGSDRTFWTVPTPNVARDDDAFTHGQEPVTIDVLANDSYSSGLNGVPIVRVTQPTAGSVRINGGSSITYTPSSAFESIDVFTYTIGSGVNASTATVTVRDTFDATAGSYNALVATEDSAYANSGSIVLVATRTGAFTGTLNFAAISYPIKGKLRYDGQATVELLKDTPSRIVVGLTIDPATRQLSGSVFAGNASVPFSAGRVNFDKEVNPAPQAGRYTFLIPVASESGLSEGHGFGTMRVSQSGSVIITGRTGAGAAFSTTAYLGSDARFPLYGVCGEGNRTLHGSIEFRNVDEVSDCDGPLVSSTNKTNLRTGISFIGSRFIAPPKGALLLAWHSGPGNGSLTMGGPVFANTPGLIPVELTPAHQLVCDTPNAFKCVLNKKTGLYSGEVATEPGKTPLPFKGAIFQRQSMAGGYVKRSNGTGWMQLDETLVVSPGLGGFEEVRHSGTIGW